MTASISGVFFAFLLHVSVLLEFAYSQADPASKSTVIVMRHCLRSTDDNDMIAIPGLSHSNDYSSQPWFEFPVPAWFCLPRGEELLEAQGRQLKAQGGLPMPLHAVADDMPVGQRDNVTMQRILGGLGLTPGTSDVSAIVDSQPFATQTTAACARDRPSLPEMQAGLDAFIAANPLSASYARKLERMYEIAGDGVAGNWTGLGCRAEKDSNEAIALLSGACEVGHHLAERLLMEWGGGLPTAWGQIDGDEVAELLDLWTTGMNIWFSTQPMLGYLGAPIAAAVIDGFHDDKRGTNLLVGHDTNLIQLGSLLNLTWPAGPFPTNSALPGSMLRFDRDGDLVTATFMYPADYGSLDGTMTSVPAVFAETGKNTIALSVFRDHLVQGTITSCGAPTRSPAAHQQTEIVV
eukprot:TRINITY_DN4113_c0_g1_i1.p1 TRINITY_DN4113_c0_g1~~TRINITY_DN4113_c0_g1_i1.p1  ORF type:complete len:406 (-),score=53.77 TRINITY_DN4113_c0_g1_i1:109-1326(-)